jgi:hypothetical protein
LTCQTEEKNWRRVFDKLFDILVFRPSIYSSTQHSHLIDQGDAMAAVSLEDFISEKFTALKLEIPSDDVSSPQLSWTIDLPGLTEPVSYRSSTSPAWSKRKSWRR